MTLLDGLGQWLHDQGHGIYTTTGSYGDDEVGIVIGASPPSPDEVVAVESYPGPEADMKLGYDEPRVQLRVRGVDPSRTFQRAQNIYDDWHGAGRPLTLPSGHEVQSVIGVQSGPIPIGRDSNGRPEYTLNFRVERRNISTHRT